MTVTIRIWADQYEDMNILSYHHFLAMWGEGSVLGVVHMVDTPDMTLIHGLPSVSSYPQELVACFVDRPKPTACAWQVVCWRLAALHNQLGPSSWASVCGCRLLLCKCEVGCQDEAHLLEALLSPEGSEVVLSWLLQGLSRYHRDGSIGPMPTQLQLLRNQHVFTRAQLERFLEEEYVHQNGVAVVKTFFYEHLRRWMQQHDLGCHDIPNEVIFEAMEQLNPAYVSSKRTRHAWAGNGGPQRVFHGIKPRRA